MPNQAVKTKTSQPVAPDRSPLSVVPAQAGTGPVLQMPAVAIPGVRLRAMSECVPGDIADRLGAVKALISQLCVVEAALKESLITAGISEADGAVYRATVSESVRCSLDGTAIRGKMGDSWCAKFEKRSSVTTVRVTARKRI